ncbi:MAG: hypothetical protein M0R17_15130 [Candidatus Omnitrophica bacterium]|jgi:hypothetical protein|nr:hypothetical protein [Candidatus Omnitrophota bacterium]
MKKVKFLIIFIFGSFNLCFGAEESITITTYYPSPYGSYNELATNKLAVGDTNGNGTLDAADQPNRNGDIRLKAQTGDPATWPAGAQGQIAYSSLNNSLYYYNGSTWSASGGGGFSYTYYCFSSTTYGAPVCTNAGGSQGYCPSGYTQKLALGSWGCCSGSFSPPGCSCGAGFAGCSFGSNALGYAYVCSQ